MRLSSSWSVRFLSWGWAFCVRSRSIWVRADQYEPRVSVTSLITVSTGLTAVFTTDSMSWAARVPETPIRPTLMIRRAPKAVHSRRIVRRVAVIAFIRPPWPRYASARRAGVGVRHQYFFHQIELFEHHSGAADDACQRVVGDVDRHLGCLRDALVEARQERPTTSQDDALVHDVGHELRRR